MKIKITSDSTCDLAPQLVRQHNISIIPLYINIGDKCLKDGVEVSPADIYAHVDAGGDICSTAAVNIIDYVNFFRPLSEEYDAVIHVNISSELSSCCQNASLAAQAFQNVYVVDSRNLSTGNGLVALRAAEMAEAGMGVTDILSELKELTPRLDVSFIPECLDYLRKGGRCSSLAALGANLLHLRPCIEVRDGKMSVGKKYRGSFDKCLIQYVHERLGDASSLETDRIFITHSGVADHTLEAVRSAIMDCGPFADIIVTDVGCTISSHCGPGTLGLLYTHKK